MPFEILEGDCLDVLPTLPADSVQLLITSPPYAAQRAATYGGIEADKYTEWFLPRAAEMMRVLRPDGTFILNIKENVSEGERSTYVMELVLALKRQGWLWTEEFIWHKKNATPGKWPNRFRDAWEHLFQFNRQRKFAMYQDEVRVPVGDWAESRMDSLSETDQTRHQSATASGFGRNVSKWKGRDTVYPDNVLTIAAECSNQGHPAVFPEELPAWFIALFTQPGDTVLDTFSGSGTTGRAALALGRNYIGIEMKPEYVAMSRLRLDGHGWDPKRPLEEQVAEASAPDVLDLFG